MYFSKILALLLLFSNQLVFALNSKIVNYNPGRTKIEISTRAQDIRVISVKKSMLDTKVHLTEINCYNDDYCPDKKETLEQKEFFIISIRYYDIYEESGYVYESLRVEALGKSLADFRKNLQIKDNLETIIVKNPILKPVSGCFDVEGGRCMEDSGLYREVRVKKRYLSL